MRKLPLLNFLNVQKTGFYLAIIQCIVLMIEGANLPKRNVHERGECTLHHTHRKNKT